jgi:hypothetical protein
MPFLADIYRAAQGHDGRAELQRRQKKPIPSLTENDSSDDEAPATAEEEQDHEAVKRRFNVYFPSRDTVLRSKNGISGAGTVCFQEKWWRDSAMPKSVLRDCVSERDGVLMHNKVLYARPSRELVNKSGKKIGAWAYVGSANLSESAWYVTFISFLYRF